ncbi:MAG: hypothetical protein COS29_04990, partial [Candidatus Omnitrophica bacterium CG02_land_8_20_14_3_00__42_8]
TYDALERITRYKEEIKDQIGNKTIRLWQDGRYNDKSQLISYRETMTSSDMPGIVTVKIGQNMLYDTLGRLYQVDETTKTSGTDNYGKDIDYTETLKRIASGFNDKGWSLGYKETMRKAARQLDEAGVYEDILDTTTNTSVKYSFNNNGKIIGQTEIIREQSDENNDGFLDVDHIIQTVRTGMKYDSLSGRLIGYRDTITDSATPGNPILREVSNISYDASGLIMRSHQIETDVNGVRTNKDIWNMVYDGKKRLVGFSQKEMIEGKDEFGNLMQVQTEIVRSNTIYNAIEQVVSYKDTINTSDTDLTKEITYSNMSYDKSGLAYGYTKHTHTSGNSDGVWMEVDVTEERLATQYNRHGQALSYSETSTGTDAPGQITRTDMDSIVYDSWGRIAEFVQHNYVKGVSKDDPGVYVDYSEDITQYAAVYEDKGVLILDGETFYISEIDGYINQSETSGTDGASELEYIRTTVRSEIDFNSLGQMIHYKEQSSASDAQGKLTYTDWTAGSFDGAGNRVFSGYDVTGRIYSYKQVDRSVSIDPATGDFIYAQNIDGEELYNALDEDGHLVFVTLDTPGVVFEIDENGNPKRAMALEIIKTTVRTETYYDGFGQNRSYRQTVHSTDAPGNINTIDMSDMKYDPRDRLFSYHEVTVDVQGKMTTKDVSGMSYDDMGRNSGYQENLRTSGEDEYGNPLDITTTTLRSAIRYNGLNQMIAYHDYITTSDTELRKNIDWRVLSYDINGLIVGFKEDTHVTGRNDEGEIDWFNYSERKIGDFDIDGTLIRSWYNSLGQMIGYVETNKSSDKPEVVTTRTLSNMIYDSVARLSEYIQDDHITSINNDGSLDYHEVTKRTGARYNEMGYVGSYQESVRTYTEADEDGDGNVDLDLTNITYRSNIDYNELSQTVYYHDSVQAGDAPDKNIEIDWHAGLFDEAGNQIKAGYDVSGRSFAYKQVTHTTNKSGLDSEGNSIPELDITTTVVRTKTLYGGFGSVKAYCEEMRTDEAEDVVIITEKNNIYYDSNQRVRGYEEVVTKIDILTRGNKYNLKTNTKRSQVNYNDYGQISFYHQESYSDASTNLLTEEDWYADKYNVFNQIESYHTNILEIGADIANQLNKTTDLTRFETHYNSLGLIDYYKQKTISNDAVDKAIEETWDAREFKAAGKYNSLGQIEKYTTTTREYSKLDNGATFDKTTTTIRDIATYQIDPALKLVGEPVVTGSGYDNKGRLVSYRDVTFSDEANDKTKTVYHFDTVYNKFGMMSEYRQKSIDTGVSISGSEINLETNVYRHLIDYDKLGRINLYTQETSTESASAKKEIINWRAEKYNLLGQLTAYYEDVQDFAQGEVSLGAITHNHRFDIEYTNTGLLKYYTQISVSEDASSALTTTEKWWADLPASYNSLGQLLTFRTNIREEGSYNGNYLSKITDLTRIETNYNSVGLIDHYKQETISNDAQGKAVEEVWDADRYNTIGQVEKYTTSTREYSKSGNGAAFDKTVTTVRTIASYSLLAGGEIITDSTKSGYDIYGRLYSYCDKSESTDVDNKKTDSYMLSTKYDPAGRIYGYHQISIEKDKLKDGAQFNLRNEIKRILTEYDLAGRVSHYIQTSVSDAASDKVDTLDWTAGAYNDLGQLIKYNEIIHTKVEDENNIVILDKTTTNKRRDISYTNTGLLKHYIEETVSNATPDLKTVLTWDADYYNELGQIVRLHTNTVEFGMSGSGLLEKITNTARLDTHYNSVGLVDYYQQENISNDAEDKAIREIWDARESTGAGRYNSLGQVEKYTTSTREYSKSDSGAALDKTTTTVRLVVLYNVNASGVVVLGVDNNPVIVGSGYDNKGRTRSYIETIVSDDAKNKQVINL